MINTCPGGPEWNKLVKAIGEFEAYRDYVENGETIRSVKEVLKSKPDLSLQRLEGSLEGSKLSKEIEGKLEANKDQLIALLGQTMYSNKLKDVVYKELLQNSFDAIKISQSKNLISKGKINIVVDSINRTISFEDNGIGMSPEIVQKAFFTIGGTYKGEGVDNKLKSGGLGLAKMAFIFGSERLILETVNDTIKTTVDATSQEIRNDNFKISTQSTNEPNGTKVTVKIPESYIDAKGIEREIDFPEYISSEKEYSFLSKPLIGNVDVTYEIKNRKESYQKEQKEVLELGKVPKNYELFTKASTDFGDLDIYIDFSDVTGKHRPDHLILSSGLYQFKVGFKQLSSNDKIPLNIIINVKPKVSTDNPQYPFNNQREDFRPTVSEDIVALNNYLGKLYKKVERALLKNSFNKIKNVDSVDIESIDQSIIDANKKIVKSFGPTSIKDIIFNVLEENTKEDSTINISNGGYKTKRESISKEEITKDEEKKYSSSFNAKKQLEDSGELSLDLDYNKPVVHNNTTMELDAKSTKFLTEISSIMLNYKKAIIDFYGDDYSDNIKTQLWGVSIDKSYGGVNVNPEFLNMLAINPFYNFPDNPKVDAVNYIAVAIDHLIVHELNHNFVRSEGAEFTGRFLKTYSEIHSLPNHFELVSKLKLSIKNNLETLKKLNYEYSQSENVESGFEGNKLETDNERRTNNGIKALSNFNTGVNDQTNTDDQRSIERFGEIIAGKINPPLSENKVINDMIETIPGLKTYSSKVELTPVQTDMRKANSVVEAMVQQLSARLNIPYQFVTIEEARAILEGAGKPFTNQSGFYVGGKVYLVATDLNLETAIHEFSHPFVRAIQQENPELFEKIISDLALTEEGQKIMELTKKLYGENDPLYKEEVVVRALTRAAKMKVTGALDQYKNRKFKSIIDRILYAIKKAFRKYLGKNVEVSNLDVDTTIDDLAEMLLSADQITFDVEAVSQEDVLAEERRVKEEIDTFLNIGNTDSGAIAIKTMINDYTRIAVDHIDKLVKNKNLKDMAEILRTSFEESDYKAIKDNLKNYRSDLESKINDVKDRLEYETQRATALVNSIYRIEYMSKKMVLHMRDLLKEDITPDTVRKFYYYSKLVEDWSKVMKKTRNMMNDENVVTGPIVNVVSSIEGFLNSAKDLDAEMSMRGSLELLTDTLKPLSERVKKYYEDIIQKLEAKGAPERLLDKYRREYKEASLDKADLRQWLSGERGDTHAISAWLESFMNIQDPVIFGLATYINNNISEVLVKAQQRQNGITMSIEPMMRAAGLDLKDYEALNKLVGYTDKEVIYDSDGKYTERDRMAFLHHIKGYYQEVGSLNDKIKEAQKKAEETGDTTEVDILQAELKNLLHNNFYNDYDSRVFAAESLFTQDEIGQKAYVARLKILNKIGNLDNSVSQKTEFYDSDFQSLRDSYWKEYRQLYLFSYPDGTMKQPGTEDYDITVRLREHREKTKEFYEFVPIKGMFQGSLRSYEEQLRAEGLTPKQFEEKRQQWIDENTRVKIKPEFWQEVQSLIEELKTLKENLPVNEEAQTNLDELFKELNDQMSAFRDEDGQPDAMSMSEEKLKRIMVLDEAISEERQALAKYTGLTEEEEEFFKDYQQRAQKYIASKIDPYNMDPDQYRLLSEEFRDLNLEDSERYDYLYEKKESASEDPTLKEAISEVLAKLNALRSRVATEQYIDKLNSFIKTAEDGTGIKASTVKNRFGTEQFDKSNVNSILEDIGFLDILFSESPEFQKWFNDNHMVREYQYEYGPKEGEIKTSYVRSSAWSVTRPVDERYYEKTELLDDAGNVMGYVDGVPTSKYFRRQLKSEYRTERVTIKEALEMGDVTKATVDHQGNWLPKPNSKYRNEDYYILQRTNKSGFDLLTQLHLYHQQNQDGLNANSRLGVFLPRYRKDSYESLISGQTKDKISSMIKNFKSSFRKAADDFDEGYNAENQVTYVNLDMFDEQLAGIPITGKSDLDLDETSVDVISGMMRYMLSAERQKKLIEINPNVRAIQNVVNGEKGSIKDMNKGNKQDYLTQGITNFATKKGRSVRSQVINAMIEREFEGKQLVGVTENLAWANKLAGNMMKLSSFAFFAFDAASALKNAFNAQFQAMIAAAGGDGLDMGSLAKGAHWAQIATSQVSFELYKFGPKSLNVQLVEMFDPEATRFDKNSGQKFAESSTRTFTRDVVNMRWMTNFRAWTQLNATLQLFGGIMNHQKVNQTVNGVTREIPYIDAWEVKDGQLTVKQGVDPEWNIGGKKFLEVRNKVQAANKNLNGSLSRMDQPMANRYLLYRMVAYMKTWFTRQFMSRWGFRGNWKEPRARWDVQANDMTIGYYTQVMDTLRRGIMTLGADLKYMTDTEKVAAKKVAMEVGMIILGSVLIKLLFDYDDDDEDRYNKLRQQSGPLPGLFVADSPFEYNTGGYLENQALFLAKTTMNELEAMTPMFGYDDYINMLKLESVAVSSTVVNMGKTIQGITQLMLNDPGAQYKRAVGPYSWQQQGEYKSINYMMKAFGISGKIIDPVNALKNFESAQDRFK